MGVIIKSVLGLGSVYIAMFAPAASSPDVTAAAKLCTEAARSGLEDSASLRSKLALAGCGVALTQPLQRQDPARPAPPRPAPTVAVAAPPPPPSAPPSARSRMAAGTLSEADLRDPWFGPTEHARKARPPG
jgi:hypothetical protein